MNEFVQISVISLCAALFVTFLASWAFDYFSRIRVEKTTRLEEHNLLPVFIKIYLPFRRNVFFLCRSEFFKVMLKNSQVQLDMAGYGRVISAEDFLAVKILSFIFALIVFSVLSFVMPLFYSGVLAFLLAVYPILWIRMLLRKKQLEIIKALPNVLDNITLLVEAGKDFFSSLRDVTARRKHDFLNEELIRTLGEIQIGKKRSVALVDLSNRLRISDLTVVVNSVIKAEELGISISDILKIQSDLLRTKRFSRAEKIANEAPVKILLPLIFLIFPIVFIILMAPMALKVLNVFN